MEGSGKGYRVKPAHFVGLRLRFQPVGLPGRRVGPTPRRETDPPAARLPDVGQVLRAGPQRYKGTYTIV